jgi:hypothetical protein
VCCVFCTLCRTTNHLYHQLSLFLSLCLLHFRRRWRRRWRRRKRFGEGHHPGFSWDRDLKGKKLHLSFCLLEESEKDTHPE